MKMNKLCLTLVGVLTIAAIVSARNNEEDSGLTEDLTSSRLERSLGARRRKTKKGRKSRKGKKTRKSSKGKKGRKWKKSKKINMRGRRKIQPESRSKSNERAVYDTCLQTAVFFMRQLKDNIGNFERQFKRIQLSNGTFGSKYSKKGVFRSAAQILLSVGGGKKSGLQCAGYTANEGAAQLKNITDFLFNCETSVGEACNPSYLAGLVNNTKLVECNALSAEYKAGVEDCLWTKTLTSPSTSFDEAEACACWTEASMYEAREAFIHCKLADENRDVAAAVRTCKNTFSKCRKYEDEAANSISACKSNADGLKKTVG